MTDHKPPQEIDTEESVLVSILTDQEHREKALESLIPEDFYSTANRAIFLKCKDFSNNGETIYPKAIYSELSEKEKQYVKLSDLISLVDTVPLSMNIEKSIAKLKDAAYRREAIEICNAIEKRCYSKNGGGAGIEQLAQEIIDGAKPNRKMALIVFLDSQINLL
jgi:replicative DNA helicase